MKHTDSIRLKKKKKNPMEMYTVFREKYDADTGIFDSLNTVGPFE